MDTIRHGEMLAAGAGEGPLLRSDVGLSFWGGVDPLTGMVIDRHHPLHGQSLDGKILAIPSGRGSCTGSVALLELILNGRAPAAIVACESEEILSLGALVARALFERAMPVLRVDRADFADLGRYAHARVAGGRLELFHAPPTDVWRPAPAALDVGSSVRLDPIDEAFLAGRHGVAAQTAMRLLLETARIQRAPGFIDVSQAHIDGCIYTGPASLRFARKFADWGARVRVPTTLNAISVDKRRWRALGVSADLGDPAAALADAYVEMGAAASYTCAPYLLSGAPAFGAQIGWAESNAVVYANSVIGARTLKYPDFLDLCVALTGRAPESGCHTNSGRRATIGLIAERPDGADDSFWPLLGLACGEVCGGEIPLIVGLEGSAPTTDDLKAFSAAFATNSAAAMFHMAGVTPEADGQNPSVARTIARQDLRRTWQGLNTAQTPEIGLVSLGNPHFSPTEFAAFAALVQGRRKAPQVEVVVTCGRAVHEEAERAGHVDAVESFGARIVTDTCWCMLGEPVIPPAARTLMTNSGKYARYAPGLTGRAVRFGSMAACVEAACAGSAGAAPPKWLDW